jgi:transaldolase
MVATQKYLFALLTSLAMVSASEEFDFETRSDEVTLEARQNALLNGLQGSIMNRRQQIDKMNAQIREHPEHANAARVTTFIQGVDSQIDNAISTVANALAPFTGGLSVAIGRAILGPFVQSVTDGAEVFLGNVIGGALDMTTNPAMISKLSRSYTNLISQAGRYNINTNRLQSLQQQIQNHIPKN